MTRLTMDRTLGTSQQGPQVQLACCPIHTGRRIAMENIIVIVAVVLVVLFVLGYFGRGRLRG